ncbi:MAG: hypothetical protein C4K58_06075 [Flavobacteriaceae bacterium]|nr:MAG: hypothetical protein C4K58_06075 [Flavobacteriaceae bacterium]
MKTTKNILFVSNVYPDANTTAAGKRTLQLMLLFVDENYKVSFASSSLKQSDQKVNLEQKNITCFDFQINDESFEKLIKENHFDMVVFDRFYTEEQVGWMVDMHLPGALKVLDMQDFHALRLSREEFYFQGIDYTPLSLYENQVAKRELASLHRCDFSLVISDYELNLLWRNFSIPQDKTLMLTMYYEKPEEQSPDYESRKDLLCVGNFLHKPNLEATRILKHTIWPKVRTKLPEVNLHLYGAYPTAEVQQMHLDTRKKQTLRFF